MAQRRRIDSESHAVEGPCPEHSGQQTKRRRQDYSARKHQGQTVVVLSPVGVAISGLGIRYASNAGWIAVCLVFLAAFSAAPPLAARVNRLQQGRKAAERCMKRLLHACGHSFGYPACHIRVNVMKFSVVV